MAHYVLSAHGGGGGSETLGLIHQRADERTVCPSVILVLTQEGMAVSLTQA